MSSLTIRRLQAELKSFPSANSAFELVECTDILCWKVKVRGADETIYSGEEFFLQFKFADGYPIQSPEVTFVESIPVHEHVYSNGHICLSTLYDEWAASMTVESVCLSIISMLSSATEKKTPIDDKSYCARAVGRSPKHTNFYFHDGKC